MERHRKRAQIRRADALWYEPWLRLLATESGQLATTLERMPPQAFIYEVCLLHANYIRREAERLARTAEDKATAKVLQKERMAMRASKHWLDRLVIERFDLDRQAPR